VPIYDAPLPHDLAGEAVAAPVHCFDVPASARIVFQCLSYLAYARSEGRFGYDGVRPYLPQQLVLQYQSAWSFHQIAEDGKRLRGELERLRSARHSLIWQINAEGA
jgi:hypothetical protein